MRVVKAAAGIIEQQARRADRRRQTALCHCWTRKSICCCWSPLFTPLNTWRSHGKPFILQLSSASHTHTEQAIRPHTLKNLVWMNIAAWRGAILYLFVFLSVFLSVFHTGVQKCAHNLISNDDLGELLAVLARRCLWAIHTLWGSSLTAAMLRA